MLMLHGHLPFVRHPEYGDPFEERWLFEAIIECYLPLLGMLDNLERDNIRCRFTMSLTPPLISMLKDSFLQQRFLNHLNRLIELAEKEVHRTRNMLKLHDTACKYSELFQKHKTTFVQRYKMDIAAGFLEYLKKGHIEITTCCATHGFLPLLGFHRQSVFTQITEAVKHHEYYLGYKPQGIWLAECGYNPQDESILQHAGLKYFFVESHGLTKAVPQPVYKTYGPVRTPCQLYVFARDRESAEEVWSAQVGYPGDGNYREYYRDIGYDLDMDYIAPYIHESGVRINTGIKYYKVTAAGVDSADKEPYSFEMAQARTKVHAEDFLKKRIRQILTVRHILGIKPLVVSPYDMELYGHWWYEGPKFLENLFRAFSRQSVVLPVTATEYLESSPSPVEVSRPYPSSWGMNGYNEYWLNEKNHWMWKHLHVAAMRMKDFARQYERCHADSTVERILNQALRELLLAQSSDWPFILSSQTTTVYAANRTAEHLSRFHQLCDQLKEKNINKRLLIHLENKNNIFPLIDFRDFAVPDHI
ncbi:MAG TPA: 1,4-alpha-glucan branching protein domain-containing protein [Thermodesulfovibrionia bacterium]|nr:1,4-alpha-glucan branching protein domain-containing protein [Thermodesulfovibrionia bacterium]